ncbi:formate-dependent nitrite reductase membrane component NrfD [Sporomusaceae bacterium BoRhaA]|uniref:NrfD/PsrC family molybdoenzyme membrane anchor subunit n=1 Tax=Pelorhabdus rhamnosifermentans TaxID=2772457 RepID=UPI001C060D64|nr:NrfD/PsrC family molybdoenzyme membrane anchor subunit [Pelorhabdus rhamnosifermentans]MBU2702349.1 formate-dependent nitrite reductase membrane component NrfD [Pelorhabdus rhamnosifermentans]
MDQKHDVWGWLLAVDIFLAGMGGGMLVIIGILDLFIGTGRTSLLGNLLAPVFIGIGASILILELGRPFQALRVFMNPKATLTIGAWFMSFAITFGFVYASFGIDMFFWSGWVFARKIFAVLCMVCGLVVASYPGVLLGRHKGRPFWNGPGMIILFLLSSLVTGVAAHILSGFVLPPSTLTDVLGTFPKLAAGLLTFQLLLWFGYILVKRSGGTSAEAIASQRWIKGDLSSIFQIGFLLLGTLLPLVLTLSSSQSTQAIGAALVLLGGIIMRILVIRGGEDRTWLPGEQKYRSRLPKGDETFLRAWNK